MPIEAIGILGAGKTGSQIAEILLTSGFQVRIYDDFRDRLSVCMAKVKWNLKKSGREELVSNIEPVQDFSLFKGADIVMETINREMDERKLYFKKLKEFMDPGCILGINPGVSTVEAAVEELSLDPEISVGLNFVKPPFERKLVEVIRTEAMKDSVLETVVEFLNRMGRKPVIVKDNPGAIYQRLLRPYFNAAFNVLAAGKGFPSDIDRAFKNISGASAGPFETMDFIGMGKDYANALKIYELLGKPERLAPHPLQDKLVQYGQVGRSSTAGIYLYEDGEIAGENPMLENIVKYLGLRKESDETVFAEIFRPVISEAKTLAGEIMVSEYDMEAVAKFGLGWPKGIFGCYRENKELLTPKKKSEFENLDAF